MSNLSASRDRKFPPIDPQTGLPLDLGLPRKPVARVSPTAPIPRIALTQAEASDALGCSEEFFVEHVRPLLRIVRGGRKRLYAVSELERFMTAHAEMWEEVGGG